MTEKKESIVADAIAIVKAKADEIRSAKSVGELDMAELRLRNQVELRDKVESAIALVAYDGNKAEKTLDEVFGDVYRHCNNCSCACCELRSNGKVDKLSCGLSVCDFAKSVTGVKRAVADAKDNVENDKRWIAVAQDRIDDNRRRVLDGLEQQLKAGKECLLKSEGALAEAVAKRDVLDKHYGIVR